MELRRFLIFPVFRRCFAELTADDDDQMNGETRTWRIGHENIKYPRMSRSNFLSFSSIC